MLPTVLAVLTSLLVAPAPHTPADLSVALGQRNTVIFVGAFFDISVTNHGPDPVESTTVVLTLDTPFWSTSPANCVTGTAARTVTCTLGPVPAGSTTRVSPVVYLSPPQGGLNHFTVSAAVPPDPNPGNDSVVKPCSYFYQPMPPSLPYWWLSC